jgi:hypothetical protein
MYYGDCGYNHMDCQEDDPWFICPDRALENAVPKRSAMTTKTELKPKEEKFLVINFKRFNELNSVFPRYEHDQDCKPVGNLITALRRFQKNYEKHTGKDLDQKYIVCNQDEPYADDVWNIILSDGKGPRPTEAIREAVEVLEELGTYLMYQSCGCGLRYGEKVRDLAAKLTTKEG